MKSERNRVCPVEFAGSLDNRLRKWIQNPQRILSPFIKEGMKVLDIGCGPGFFSIELAKMVGSSGKIYAVDLQEGMLEKLRNKIQHTELEERIILIKSEQNRIIVPEKVDFILAFYMVHEVPDKVEFFTTLKGILVNRGLFLLVEPKLFHVSKKDFARTIEQARQIGFEVFRYPRIHFSFSAVFNNT